MVNFTPGYNEQPKNSSSKKKPKAKEAHKTEGEHKSSPLKGYIFTGLGLGLTVATFVATGGIAAGVALGVGIATASVMLVKGAVDSYRGYKKRELHKEYSALREYSKELAVRQQLLDLEPKLKIIKGIEQPIIAGKQKKMPKLEHSNTAKYGSKALGVTGLALSIASFATNVAHAFHSATHFLHSLFHKGVEPVLRKVTEEAIKSPREVLGTLLEARELKNTVVETKEFASETISKFHTERDIQSDFAEAISLERSKRYIFYNSTDQLNEKVRKLKAENVALMEVMKNSKFYPINYADPEKQYKKDKYIKDTYAENLEEANKSLPMIKPRGFLSKIGEAIKAFLKPSHIYNAEGNSLKVEPHYGITNAVTKKVAIRRDNSVKGFVPPLKVIDNYADLKARESKEAPDAHVINEKLVKIAHDINETLHEPGHSQSKSLPQSKKPSDEQHTTIKPEHSNGVSHS